jgi:hypothetical protein
MVVCKVKQLIEEKECRVQINLPADWFRSEDEQRWVQINRIR